MQNFNIYLFKLNQAKLSKNIRVIVMDNCVKPIFKFIWNKNTIYYSKRFSIIQPKNYLVVFLVIN